ncbi:MULTISPECIES: AAA-like domain-containing protein [unclassified Okeania]|uniref:AAA-like domain-containing protein n=1 Tax=unclassified Okeania TaxID=2634635 RepID=UPI0013BC60DF|nr:MULTISPECIES: AAA-like domain-containing protein [unclassified Okeania]NES77300.1 serine/threonine protein kinase [Okeania sp. SIO1H4]NET15354.1 serine/threonine protein kinase [Okeania sp. SIO1H6]NET18134.1 serine/threonine protein kinase [Okeania sp. SIO1H5]NET93968.1 serine/threonine protein kinase [Okeania sp. SIO1H2]
MSNYTRRRGVTLTEKGSRKLIQAKTEAEIEQNKRYTLEFLSEETGLTPNTLSKVFIGSSGVDKRSLKCCFDAFNLTLLTDDYLYRKSDETCSELEPVWDSPFDLLRDRNNTPQTKKMVQPQDDLQPRPPTAPGGQMPLDSVFYIDRPIIESLCYEGIQQPGTPLNIRAPKQMGKTSLMSRILVFAKSMGYQTVSLNLQLADAKILQDLESFLQWFCAGVSKELELPNHSADFWDNSLGSKSTATDYFNDIILANLDSPLVIAIDELNQLFAYPNIASEFLQFLRTCSEQAKARAAKRNVWQKLRLVTVHSTETMIPPSINPSLLNTGLVINLPEFTPAQVQDLAQRWEQEITEPQIKQLMTLLGGHPYRLQLAFYYLQQQTITLEELSENSERATALYAEHLQQQWWNLQRYDKLLPIFTEIVNNPKPIEIKLSLGYKLQQMGLVHLEGDRASLSCELFRPFFLQVLN